MNVIDGITPGLEQIAAEFPKEFRKALMDVGSHYRKAMRIEIRAGAPAGQTVPPLHPVTIALRHKRLTSRAAGRGLLRTKAGRLQSKRAVRILKRARIQAGINTRKHVFEHESDLQGFGGKLPEFSRYELTDAAVRIGFLDTQVPGSNRAFDRWQRALSRAHTKEERRMLHVRLAKTGVAVPPSYVKPARSSVAPYATLAAGEAHQIILKSIRARLLAAANRRRVVS